MNINETMLTIGVCTLALIVTVALASWFVVNRLRWQPQPIDKVGRVFDDLIGKFNREANDLVGRYAQDFALVKFLEQQEREGTPINVTQFKKGALERATMLRVRQLETAIASHLAAMDRITSTLNQHIKNNAGSNNAWAPDIQRDKQQYTIEAEYVSSLQDQLRELQLHVA